MATILTSILSMLDFSSQTAGQSGTYRDMTELFPEAVQLAVCVEGCFEDLANGIEYNPAWVTGEVIFVNSQGRCSVSDRTLGDSAKFRYFDLNELPAAIQLSKMVARDTFLDLVPNEHYVA